MKKVIRFYDDKKQVLEKLKKFLEEQEESENLKKEYNVEYFSLINKQIKKVYSYDTETEFEECYIMLDTKWDQNKVNGYPKTVYQNIITEAMKNKKKYYIIFYSTLWDEPSSEKRILQEIITKNACNNVVIYENWIKIYGTTPGLWNDTFDRIFKIIKKLEVDNEK